ncbi:MAG: DNA polymerase III subunit alpha [Chitinophagales bacterium]|nr:DNA polymerase III subunit alpha [Chitinophagales bacterium]MDW8392993.1 DNA polymerase III subunit alpha [Chitinophagales bacterium]
MEFCHLHCHTQYSLLDGAADINALAQKAVADGQKALAITDHGNMFGVFEFVKTVQKHGLKPIVGCEFYLTFDHSRKEILTNFGMDEDGTTRGKKAFHQLLLAKNETGYRNLLRLCSLGYTEGFYFYPRIDFEQIKQHAEGLIATTCCLGGIVPQHILYRSEQEAEAIFLQWLEVFGDDYYIELQRHGLSEQDRVNTVLLRWSQRYGVRVIATNDVHYVNRQDAQAQDILLCLQTNKQVTDQQRMRFSNDEFFLKTTAEMQQLFADLPQALDSTGELASKVENLELKRKILLPVFPLPKPFSSVQQYLEHLARKGLRERYESPSPEAEERLNYELSIIEKTGFAGYFLIVQDFIQAARELGVWVGPGRGSAAGSLVAYCIGITHVDPLKYNLLFERFLNPDRITMPDMDIDFDDAGREKVIDYVVKRYGRNQVAQIVTFGTIGPKTAVRDVGRALGLSASEMNALARLIPEAPNMSFVRAYSESPDLVRLKNSGDERIRKVLRIAETLEGCVRHQGIHAAGIIIAPDDISNIVPVLLNKDNGLLVTQYEGKLIEEAGLLKMDFLGLKTLTILKEAVEAIARRHGIHLDLAALPLDDEATYRLFQSGETIGIFQFESEGMRKYLRELRPTNLEDLIAMNALYRPGPMNYIPDFIQRKHGKQQVNYLHPLVEPILKPTYGIMVYQEQIMQVAQVIAGFTLGQADLLRRAMGKKNKEEMQQQRQTFLDGAAARNIDRATAEQLFLMMEKFAEYGFNRSHAAGYALLAYQTAYLKAHYPAEFMAATLSSYMDSADNTAFYLAEVQRLGLTVLGPDINHSGVRFEAGDNRTIRFALAAIKGLGEGAVQAIVKEREAGGPYTSVFNLTARLPSRYLNRKGLESLAAAGAFDSLGTHRASYFATYRNETTTALDRAIRYGNEVQRRNEEHTLFGPAQGIHPEPPLPEAEPWSELEKLRREKEATGVYLSGYPLNGFHVEIASFCNCTIGQLADRVNGELRFAAIVTSVAHRTTRNGSDLVRFTLEDQTGNIELSLFGEECLQYRHLLEEGRLLYVKGRHEARRNDPLHIEFRVKSLMLLSEVRSRLARKVHLSFSLSDLKEMHLNKLKQCLTTYSGALPVFVQLVDEHNKPSLKLRTTRGGLNLSDECLYDLTSLDGIEVRLS